MGQIVQIQNPNDIGTVISAGSNDRLALLQDYLKRKQSQATQVNLLKEMMLKQPGKFQDANVEVDSYGQNTGNDAFNNAFNVIGKSPLENVGSESSVKTEVKNQATEAKALMEQSINAVNEANKNPQAVFDEIYTFAKDDRPNFTKALSNNIKNGNLIKDAKTLAELNQSINNLNQNTNIQNTTKGRILTPDPRIKQFMTLEEKLKYDAGMLEPEKVAEYEQKVEEYKKANAIADNLNSILDPQGIYQNYINQQNQLAQQQSMPQSNPQQQIPNSSNSIGVGQSESQGQDFMIDYKPATSPEAEFKVANVINKTTHIDPKVTDPIKTDYWDLQMLADLRDANMVYDSSYQQSNNPLRKAADSRLDFTKVYDNMMNAKGDFSESSVIGTTEGKYKAGTPGITYRVGAENKVTNNITTKSSTNLGGAKNPAANIEYMETMGKDGNPIQVRIDKATGKLVEDVYNIEPVKGTPLSDIFITHKENDSTRDMFNDLKAQFGERMIVDPTDKSIQIVNPRNGKRSGVFIYYDDAKKDWNIYGQAGAEAVTFQSFSGYGKVNVTKSGATDAKKETSVWDSFLNLMKGK